MITRDLAPGQPPVGNVKVVALGGGHGLAASLSALRRLPTRLTGIVTVADNGGSSGRLRAELGGLPPGDLRMALAALCGDDEWGRTWADVLQHRFSSDGPLHGHAVGNLLIAGIWDLLGGHVEGLDLVGQLLGARGRILPMASIPLNIEADTCVDEVTGELLRISGQVGVAAAHGRVVNVWLEPQNPPACPEAVEAIEAADWIVIGPGSWFTSVLPNLLVPGIREALVKSAAKRILVLNLGEQPGETAGLTPKDHIDVLGVHAPELRFDYVLADSEIVDEAGMLSIAAQQLGAELVSSRVSKAPGSAEHDPSRLAAAFGLILGQA